MLDLTATCKYCGRTLQEHCSRDGLTPVDATADEVCGDAPSADGRLFYWPCAANLRASSPGDWSGESGPADGRWCLRCGWSVQHHYTWSPLSVKVMGRTLGSELRVVPMLVAEWTGCRAD